MISLYHGSWSCLPILHRWAASPTYESDCLFVAMSVYCTRDTTSRELGIGIYTCCSSDSYIRVGLYKCIELSIYHTEHEMLT